MTKERAEQWEEILRKIRESQVTEQEVQEFVNEELGKKIIGFKPDPKR
jgi:hypothetical protein